MKKRVKTIRRCGSRRHDGSEKLLLRRKRGDFANRRSERRSDGGRLNDSSAKSEKVATRVLQAVQR